MVQGQDKVFNLFSIYLKRNKRRESWNITIVISKANREYNTDLHKIHATASKSNMHSRTATNTKVHNATETTQLD